MIKQSYRVEGQDSKWTVSFSGEIVHHTTSENEAIAWISGYIAKVKEDMAEQLVEMFHQFKSNTGISNEDVYSILMHVAEVIEQQKTKELN